MHTKEISKETQASKLGDAVGGMDQAHRPGIINRWADLHMKAQKRRPGREPTASSMKIEAAEGYDLPCIAHSIFVK